MKRFVPNPRSAAEQERRRYAFAECRMLLSFSSITWKEYVRMVSDVDNKPREIQPDCPRCAQPLVKLICPPSMSIASFSYRRCGDFHCPTCKALQDAGRLSMKAKTCWYTSFFKPKAELKGVHSSYPGKAVR